MTSKRFAVIMSAVLFSFLFCISLPAQGIEFGEAVSITAEVYGVEKIDRTLWLIGPKGNILELDVSEDAKNFNQLEIGDLVNITYYESIAIYLGYPGELPREETGEMIVPAPEDETPGGAAVEITDISVSIVSIDKENRFVTLKGPLGNSITTYVDESVRSFDKLKVGDVEILEIKSIKDLDENRIAIELLWKVSGSVTHFGHTHYRQNKNYAVITIIPIDEIWKVETIDIIDEARLL